MSAKSTVRTAGWVISVWQELLIGLRHRLGVVVVDEEVVAERPPPSSGVMTRSASSKISVTNGSVSAKRLQHVRVLRALPRVEERDLGAGTAAAEDALGTQQLPDRRVAGQRLHGAGRPCRPARRRGEVDRDAHRRAEASRGGRPGCGTRPSAASDGEPASRAASSASSAAPATPRRAVGAAERQARTEAVPGVAFTSGRASANDTFRRRHVALARTPRGRRGSSCRRSRRRSHRPAARRPGGRSHARNSVLTGTGDREKSMSGFGREEWRLGGITFSWSDMTALKRPAAPAAPLRWPMFDLTDPRGIEPARDAVSAEDRRHALVLHHVAHSSRGAVPFDQRGRLRCRPGVAHARSMHSL